MHENRISIFRLPIRTVVCPSWGVFRFAISSSVITFMRELIAGAGVKSASVSGAGVFKDAASDATIQSLFFSQAARNFQLVIPAFGILQGSFIVETLDYSGDHDGEAAFAITLSSAGALTFTAT